MTPRVPKGPLDGQQIERLRLKLADRVLALASWLAKPSGYHGEWLSEPQPWLTSETDPDTPFGI